MAFFQKFDDTRVNGRLSLFCIDSVHQMETSLSHALLSINTKSMDKRILKRGQSRVISLACQSVALSIPQRICDYYQTL
jgi:hypothetical protein